MSFKAHEKRVKTLLVEYKNQFKGNSFNDKRIGENDKNMSLEDKMFKRFVAERQKTKDRKSKFNLNDDDFDNPEKNFELTHYGQSLSQIERFEKVQLSDDDEVDEDDPDKGKINAEFVSKNFFGGFKDNNEENEEGKKKNRKEWIEEMIAKSKLLKYERQKERDKTLDLTEEVDKEWRNIIPLIGQMNRQLANEEQKGPTNTKPDDYDVLVRSLQFESEKAKPTDKLKTAEELEKERLEALNKNEKELLERMNKEVEEVNEEENSRLKKKNLKKIPSNHISADDIEFDDPEYLEMQRRDELSKKHKQMNEDLEKSSIQEEEKDQESQDEDKEEQSDDEETSEDEENDHDEDDDNPQDSTTDDFRNEKWVKQFENICIKKNTDSIDLKNFEGFLKSIIEKLDPSRDENNKKRLCFLTEHLITYYQSLFKFKSPSNLHIDMDLVNLLTKYIFDFTYKYGNKSTKKEPSPYVAIFKNILNNLNKDFLNMKVSERVFPQLDTLFTFKLVSNIFPTSDFRHQIVTPCLLIMTRYLVQCRIQNIGDLFRGLFLTNLCYGFISKSERYIAECVQFLNGVLYSAVDWNQTNGENKKQVLSDYELSTIYESFKRTKVKINILKKSDKLADLSLVNLSQNEKVQIDDSIKASLISYCIDLLITFSKIYSEMSSFREVFILTKKLLGYLKSENNPIELEKRIVRLEEFINEKNERPREYLKSLIKKPIANKLHEPKIQSKTKFDPRHHNSVISEKQLMTRKYKKELKSAIKEVRQDSQFLARVQLEEQLEKDAKRSQKVKEIMSSLANQEGEYQKIKRQKL